MPRHLAMLPAACVLLGAALAGPAQAAPDSWRETAPAPASDAPVALDDAYLVQQGDTLDVAAANGVLVNDLDPEGDDFIAYTIRDDRDAYSTTAGEVRVLVGVYGDLTVGVLTPPTPDGFALQEPAPNPFNPRTEIAFRTEESGHVELRVLDLRGRTVTTLVDEERPAGEHTVAWNGRDQAGASVASGTYVAELRRGGKRAVQKLALVK